MDEFSLNQQEDLLIIVPDLTFYAIVFNLKRLTVLTCATIFHYY